MALKTLVTFGCSWTYGVGVEYRDSMSDSEFRKTAWDREPCDQKSFRGILSQRYQFNNLNFSEGGSSNQRNFRKARNFFNSSQFDRLRDSQEEIVVLWGITSTSRNEVFSSLHNDISNFSYNQDENLPKFMTKYLYDHQHEVFLLAEEMFHWNQFFRNLNIKNYWYDTFNHHDYSVSSPAILNYEKYYNTVSGSGWPTWADYLEKQFDFDSAVGQEILDTVRFEFSQFIRTKSIANFVIDHPTHRDLMSCLAVENGLTNLDQDYHTSDWKIDSARTEFLISKKLLNPHSCHPTELGHQQIANMFDHVFAK